YFFFQAEDGIRDRNVTGVQTCALPISLQSEEGLLDGEVFYFTCIDAPEKIRAAVQKLPAFRQAASFVQQTDIYSGEEWLELMPRSEERRVGTGGRRGGAAGWGSDKREG